VFDEMAARIQNLIFLKISNLVVHYLDKDSKTIFVRPRGVELLEGYFEFGNVLYFIFKLWPYFKYG
jgi:hypothetical protein